MSRNQKFFSVLGLTVLSLILIFSLAYSQGRGMHGNGKWLSADNPEWWNANVPQQYWLSSDQISKIVTIRKKYDDKIQPLRQQLRDLKVEARKYSIQPDADIKKIKDYRKKIRNLQDKIDDLRLNARAEINKVLTKDQRAYFSSYAFGNWWNMGMHMDMGMDGMVNCAEMPMMGGKGMSMMGGAGMQMMNGTGNHMMDNCSDNF